MMTEENKLPLNAEDSVKQDAAGTDEPIDLLGNGKVLKKILKEGSGDYPPLDYDVTVHYTGTLTDGTKFDSSRDRDSPFTFRLGAGEVIKGWEVGVKSMKIGERCKLTLAPDFAYGTNGAPPTIPPNATLDFDVELLSFVARKKNKHTMSSSERLEAASSGKEMSNQKFVSGQYNEAIRGYDDALSYLENCDEWTEELSAQAKKIRLGCNLNLANAYLKLESWLEAVLSANAALKDDPNNIKALYRRGIARLGLLDVADGRKDLFRAAQLDPKNQEIRKELDRAKEMEKAQAEQDQLTYSKMFN